MDTPFQQWNQIIIDNKYELTEFINYYDKKSNFPTNVEMLALMNS